MRITHVIPAYLPALAYGGPVTYISLLCEALAAKDHDITVLTSDLGPRPDQRIEAKQETMNGVRVVRYPTPFRFRWAGYSPAFRRHAEEEIRGADLLHITSYRDGFGPAAARAARRCGVPWILEPMGMLRVAGRGKLRKRLFDRLVGKEVVRGAQRVVVASRIEWRECREAGVPEERLRLVPMGMKLPAIPAREECAQLRARLGISSDERVVAYLGRINYRKGLAFVARSLRRLADQGVDGFRYVLVGPDEDDGTSRGVLEAMGPHADRVLFPGPLYDQDKWRFLATADVFALASPFAENFGIVVAESMAMGTPVLVSDICGAQDFVTSASGAVLERSPQVWDERLSAILRGETSYTPAEVRAAVEPLEIEGICEDMLRIYDEVRQGR